MRLNHSAFEQAKSLIKAGKVIQNGDWYNTRPSLKDENKNLQDIGWNDYCHWFLGINHDVADHTKGRLSFLYGDFEKVHRDALIEAQKLAEEYQYRDIFEAVNTLIVRIDKMPDIVETTSEDSFPASDPPNWRGRF